MELQLVPLTVSPVSFCIFSVQHVVWAIDECAGSKLPWKVMHITGRLLNSWIDAVH